MGHSQGMDEANEISIKSSIGGVKDEQTKTIKKRKRVDSAGII